MAKTLVNWLEEFCNQLEGVEKIVAPDEYAQGLHDGSRITQDGIAKKLRYALEQEQKRLIKREVDFACTCAKPKPFPMSNHCQHCLGLLPQNH